MVPEKVIFAIMGRTDSTGRHWGFGRSRSQASGASGHLNKIAYVRPGGGSGAEGHERYLQMPAERSNGKKKVKPVMLVGLDWQDSAQSTTEIP